MLHWAPLQQRGASGSPYSIKDQLRFDGAILEKDGGDGGFEEVETALRVAKEKYGLGGITDVVLNHIAYDSPYLEEHPEAGQWTRAISAMQLTYIPRILPSQYPSLGTRC
jgi:glycogen debranching enzyme